METETKTVAGLRPTTNQPGHLSAWVDDTDSPTGTGRRVIAIVTEDELRAIVQAAYEQYGMLAEPSLEVERRSFAERAAAAEDAGLRAFADAWGLSLNQGVRA